VLLFGAVLVVSQVRTAFARVNGQPVMQFYFENNSPRALNHFALKFNRNLLGLAPLGNPVVSAWMHFRMETLCMYSCCFVVYLCCVCVCICVCM